MMTIGIPTVSLGGVTLQDAGFRHIYRSGGASTPPVIPDVPPVEALNNILLQDGEALLLQDGTEIMLEA